MVNLHVDAAKIYGSKRCLKCVWGRVVAENDLGREPEAVVLCSRWLCPQMWLSDDKNKKI
jgi:hypothetical protein